MNFPLDNWQFWVVSVAAVGGLVMVLKPWWPSRKQDGCNGCGSNPSRRRTPKVRLTLKRTDRNEN